VNLWIGLALILTAGVLSGNCMLPMKFVRRWAWENVWLVFTLVSLVAAPWILALILVERLSGVYAAIPAGGYTVPLLYGAGWGVAQVLFGLSITRLGLALGYAVIIGLGSLLGTLVPLFLQNREVIGTPKGNLILAGLAVMVVGIAVASVAGRRREMASGTPTGAGGSYAVALSLAVLCGLMAPMINYSFAFGQHIAQEAVKLGNPPTRAAYAVWPVTLTGGLLPNLIYCFYLLSRNRTWRRFTGWGNDSLCAVVMGVTWIAAVSIYGVSAVYLGALGTSAGWALFQIFMIMTANISGLVTGEWRAAPRGALRMLFAGLALLVAATVLIAMGNR
jgi:L-rhamnose-H+ transport protein